MTCIECRGQLDEYAEGRLSAAAARAVERHLESCSECREELDGLRLALSAMRSLEPVEPPEWLLGAISDAVDRVKPRARAWRWSWQQAGAAALAACVLVGFVVVLRPGVVRQVPSVAGTPTISQPKQPVAEPLPEPTETAAAATGPAPTAAPGAAPVVRAEARVTPAMAPGATRRHGGGRSGRGGASRSVRQDAAAPSPASAAEDGQRPRGDLAAKVSVPATRGMGEGILASVLPMDPDVAVAEVMPGGPGGQKMAWLPDEGPMAGRGASAPGDATRMTFGAGAPEGVGLGGPVLCDTRHSGSEAGQGMDVQFIPPRERLVGQEAVALLALRPTRAMNAVEVRVEPARGMRVANADGGGVVFDAPLDEGRRVTVPLRLVAQEEGRQELKVVVRTEPPDGSTRLEVAMPGFAAAPAEATEVQKNLRRNVSLRILDGEVREALQAVGREAGVPVDVSPSVGDTRVSVELQDVPAEAALRLLCQDAQLRMHRGGEGVRVYRP